LLKCPVPSALGSPLAASTSTGLSTVPP